MERSEKFKAILADIAKSKADIAKMKQEMSLKIQENFHSMTKEIFELYPELKSFGWRQYTPYFNDGEPCEFRSNHNNPMINGADDYDNDVDEGCVDIYNGCIEKDWDGKINPNYNPYYKEIVNSLKEFLNQFDDDDMYDLFDDHVNVIITAEGYTTEEYEHD